MDTTRDTAQLTAVSEQRETRGQAIKRRRLHYGIKSLREFSKASGVSREAVTAAEEGIASDETYDRLEAWLDRFDEETGDDVAGHGRPQVEIRASGIYGVAEIVMSGPVENLPEMEAAIERLIRRTASTETS